MGKERGKTQQVGEDTGRQQEQATAQDQYAVEDRLAGKRSLANTFAQAMKSLYALAAGSTQGGCKKTAGGFAVPAWPK